MGYFADYTDHSFYAAAALCLIIDLYLLRKSGPLLCIGIGSLVTGVFISLGLIESYPVALVMLAGFSCAAGGLLWEYSKPQEAQSRPLTKTFSCSSIDSSAINESSAITDSSATTNRSADTESLASVDAPSEAPIKVNAQVGITRAHRKPLSVRLA